jgi:hypothetical protein
MLTHLRILVALLFAISVGQAQTLVIPQIVDGGAWLTTIAVTNESSSSETVSLTFFQETGGGATSPWSLGFVEMTSAQDLVIAGGDTIFLHTPGTAANTTIGWGQLLEADGYWSGGRVRHLHTARPRTIGSGWHRACRACRHPYSGSLR